MDIATTKRTKDTKEKNFFKIRGPLHCPIFVSFATFVMRKSFVEWRIPANRAPEKFAQAAKNLCSAKDAEDWRAAKKKLFLAAQRKNRVNQWIQ